MELEKRMSSELFYTALLLLFIVSEEDGGGLVSASRYARAVPDCDPYPYCNGRNFPHQIIYGARMIQCDEAPRPRDRCCLPQARHIVCYNIMVDGMYLNYHDTNNVISTDFTGLCQAMATQLGYTTGKHSSAVVRGKGGTLAWRYGEWVNTQASDKHIVNLACEIEPRL